MRCRRSSSRSLGLRDCRRLLSGTGTGNNGTGTGTGPTLDVGTYTGTMSFDAAEAIFAIFTFAVGAVGTGHFDNGALLIENVSMSLRSPPLSIAELSVARPLEGAFDTCLLHARSRASRYAKAWETSVMLLAQACLWMAHRATC